MKHYLFFALSIIFGVSSFANNNDVNKTKVTIRTEIVGNLGDDIDRSISNIVSVYMDQNFLEINYYGIGEPEIYLVNSSNQIVDQFSLSDNNSVEYLPLPSTPGKYSIIIWSDTFYGEGYFVIQ